MLSRTIRRQAGLINTSARMFGGQILGDSPPIGHQPLVQHDDGKHHGHHDHVHGASLDHKFISEKADKKFMMLNGLPGTSNKTYAIDNPFHHLNGLSMFHHE